MVPNTLSYNKLCVDVYIPFQSFKAYSVPVEHMHTSLNTTLVKYIILTDSTRTAQQKPSSVCAPQYKNTELPSSANSAGDDDMYENIELKPSTEQGSTALYEDVMELSSNVA